MTLIEHDDTLRERHDDFHDVLDDHDRNPGLVDRLHQRNCRLQFDGRQPGERLVEQHQPRPRREHARDLQPLASGCAERAGAQVLPVLQPCEFEHLQRMLARRSAIVVTQERADHHVLEHGQVLERGRHLEGAPDAEARVLFRRGARDVHAVEHDTARGRQRVSGKAIEECGLAGAVRADQADDLALVDGQVRARDGAQATERFRDAFGAKQHRGASETSARCAATSRTTRPARSAQ